MPGRNERDRGKERYWRQMLRRWRHSGRTVRDFCAANRLSEPTFYSWRRTIAARDQEAAPRQTTERDRRPTRAHESDGGGPTFVPIRVVATTPALEVVLRDGRVVRVPADFDAIALRQLLAVLDEVPSC